ncbi:hypothetical protein ACDI54_27540 [Klebsiella pneumoniae]|uniref:hypothetical protein n=1 Tax=Klebsiella pneumoniae TaxID=573 RepID=UPI0035308CEA
MTTQPDKLIFTQSPKIELGSNFFINVPVILQYKETPLISIEHSIGAGFTTNIPIYHSDGTYLAKVKGSQLYRGLTLSGTKTHVKGHCCK